MVKASEGLIRVLIDGDKYKEPMKTYGVSGYPTVMFLDPEGKQVAKLAGRDAGAVKTQFTEIADKHTRGPKWMESAEKALEAGKADSKPVVLYFGDDKPKSTGWVKVFGDASFKPELFEKCAFAKVPFKKDDAFCKEWKVTEAPTLLIINNTGEKPEALKTLKAGKAKDIKTALEDAVKKLEKK